MVVWKFQDFNLHQSTSTLGMQGLARRVMHALEEVWGHWETASSHFPMPSYIVGIVGTRKELFADVVKIVPPRNSFLIVLIFKHVFD